MLAGRINLSPSPCLSRVKKLEQTGIIDRRVTLLNPKAMGLEINAYIQVKLDKQPQSALENFRDAVERIPEDKLADATAAAKAAFEPARTPSGDYLIRTQFRFTVAHR